jgi:hypothetical protein
MNHQSFNQWLPQCEAELRAHVHRLYNKSLGWRLGIDSGDLFHDVVAKLVLRNHSVSSRNELFGLVGKVAFNRMRDLARKRSLQGKLFSTPMPPRTRPLPGSTLETVAAKGLSPVEQLALRDEIEAIKKASREDPRLGSIFETVSDLVECGEATSITKIGQHLHLPYKQAAKSLGKLRSLAKGI